jgi:hypothetical protein
MAIPSHNSSSASTSPSPVSAASHDRQDLAGRWAFQLDPSGCGVYYRWFDRKLESELSLPGSLQGQGFGDAPTTLTRWIGDVVDRDWFSNPRYAPYREADNFKVPFWLQAEKHYRGCAWYQRRIEIPESWRGRRITLFLERPHWETRVWLDNQYLGSNNSLSTAHVYELDANVEPGPHFLTICVNNEMIVNVGSNAHGVSEHTQSNWNGVVGRVELHAGSPVFIDDVQVFPNVAGRSARVELRLRNALTHEVMLDLAASCGAAQFADRVAVAASSARSVSFELNLGPDAALWDEFAPHLHELVVRTAGAGDGVDLADERALRFGLREIGVAGTQITMNGRPIFLRGTLECCIFPRTGFPPTDVDSWRRIFHIARAHGLNQLRFHSWCPPEAAFVAADEAGFYLQIECPVWANQGTTIGEGGPLDAWIYEEAHRIVRDYGNHASFVMMAHGNEPAGRIHEFLSRWVNYWSHYDPRRICTGGAGWPILAENQYHNIPEPRVQAWGEELRSRINALPPETMTDYADWVQKLNKPIISHEIGQWCAYPNFDEIEKYTGVLKARNFEIFRESLQANHMGDQAHDFLIASGKLQTLCYKEDIESAMRTPGFAGFHLLDLHDFPGQGTALVGVLDAFWDSKGYVSAEEYRRFCNSTVLLARLPKRYWRSSEVFTARIDVAHFGAAPIENAVVTWRLLDEAGAVVAHGALPPRDIPLGNGTQLGEVHVSLKDLPPARRYRFVTALPDAQSENDWDVWVFADAVDVAPPADVLVTSALDDAAHARLEAGGKVLLLLPPSSVRAKSVVGFSSVFWNTSWTRKAPGRVVADALQPGQTKSQGQAPHTLGILCKPEHAAFAHFPTEFHSNWQWWELIHGAAAMTLDHMPPALRPLVQPIDTWFDNHRLGLLFEARVGAGSLLVCSMDLQSNLDERIVARQFLHSLYAYLSSPAFAPAVAVGVDHITSL